jgi:photosystem II stability/assembly factor-like uncharacterized protein
MKNLTLILLLIILSSCNWSPKSKIQNEAKSEGASTNIHNNLVETKDGIIYFSLNNGLTWENKSDGLPDTISIGLGAIAVSGNSLAIATKEKGVYLFDFQKYRWINMPTDRQIIENNPGPITFYKNKIYVGTQSGGVFSTADQGKNWINNNTGLVSLTIRKLNEIDDKLYAATNAGLYSYNDLLKKWELEYGNNTLQVNGITEFEESIYIATNQGAFTTPKNQKEWKQIISKGSLHNISSDDNTIYAMVYSELLSSTDKGQTWQNIQNGLPAQLYTFNVIKNGNSVFAGQWDGVYRKDKANETWKLFSNGLPARFAIANMKLSHGIIIVSGSERKLRKGLNTDK